MLTKKQGKTLLELARKVVKGETPQIPNKNFLKEKLGVFVTITLYGELRGCIGLPYPVKPLGQAVVEAANSAAFKDPRFLPLGESEIGQVELEVSVLTKPEKCKLEDIKKGDGVILEHSGRSSLFLPQVWEQLPTKTEFLEHLSMKAFLPREAYKTAKYKKFKVQIFK
jgi:AmmeMemoRadiSam system protein A